MKARTARLSSGVHPSITSPDAKACARRRLLLVSLSVLWLTCAAENAEIDAFV